MGSLDPTQQLLNSVQRAALLALRDPRFASEPLTCSDLHELEFEITILGRLRQTAHPERLVVGRDGILIRHPQGQGCFLPQVAVAHGLTADAFLTRCCTEKAGLAGEAWRSPQARIYLFRTQHCGGALAGRLRKI
jgi:uncharacterized protein (TIGR00296 family)